MSWHSAAQLPKRRPTTRPTTDTLSLQVIGSFHRLSPRMQPSPRSSRFSSARRPASSPAVFRGVYSGGGGGGSSSSSSFGRQQLTGSHLSSLSPAAAGTRRQYPPLPGRYAGKPKKRSGEARTRRAGGAGRNGEELKVEDPELLRAKALADKGQMQEAVAIWARLAKGGQPDACCMLGRCYEAGKGVPLDLDKAFDLYCRAATRGQAVAQCNLGLCYERGKGVYQDYGEAVKWYRRAAAQNNAAALCNLGRFYLKGRISAEGGGRGGGGAGHGEGAGKEADAVRAFSLFQRAEATGQGMGGRAEYQLGICQERGQGVNRNLKRAFGWYRAAAHQGHAKAMCRCGAWLIAGVGTPADPRTGIEWLQRAMRAGSSLARAEYARCVEQGLGISKDTDKAVRLYRQAVDAGIPLAMHRLAHLLLQGAQATGAEDEANAPAAAAAAGGGGGGGGGGGNGGGAVRQARRLFRRAVALGHSASFASLGLLHLSHPMPRERRLKSYVGKAARRFKQGALAGDAAAFYQLGLLHHRREGLPHASDDTAFELIREAALRGSQQAMFLLPKLQRRPAPSHTRPPNAASAIPQQRRRRSPLLSERGEEGGGEEEAERRDVSVRVAIGGVGWAGGRVWLAERGDGQGGKALAELSSSEEEEQGSVGEGFMAELESDSDKSQGEADVPPAADSGGQANVATNVPSIKALALALSKPLPTPNSKPKLRPAAAGQQQEPKEHAAAVAAWSPSAAARVLIAAARASELGGVAGGPWKTDNTEQARDAVQASMQ